MLALPQTTRAQISGITSCTNTAIVCVDSSPPGVEILVNGVLVAGGVDTVPPNAKVQVTAVVCADEELSNTNPWSAVLDGTDITSKFVPSTWPIGFLFPCRQQGQTIYDVDSITIGPGQHKLVVTGTTAPPLNLSLSKAVVWYQPKYGVSVRPLVVNDNVPINDTRQAIFTLINDGGDSATYGITATCSGAAFASTSGCVVSPNPLHLNSGAQGQIQVTYTTGTTALVTGTVSVAVNQQNPDSAQATGAIGIRTVALQTPPLNADAAPLRYRCFTAYVARNAEYQCGDLVYVYEFPTIHRLGKSATPRLIYDTQGASSHPLVGADVSVPVHPDSIVTLVQAYLYLDGNTSVKLCNASWPGSGFPMGQFRRIVCSFSGRNLWGIHTYEMVVQATIAPGGSQLNKTTILTTIADERGQLGIEDNFTSPFGAGWTVEGIEAFNYDSTDHPGVWTSGDGNSMQEYTPKCACAGNTVWYPFSKDHADSITLNSDGTRTHWMPHGTQHKIGANGIQAATIDPLGYQTTFAYNGEHATLSSIQLPQMTGTGATPISITYTNPDTATQNDAITVPTGRPGVPGTFTLHRVHNQLLSIASPDADTVYFGYTNGVMTSVTDKNHNVTTFTYDSAYKLTSSTISMGNGQPSIVRTFRAAESVGLGSSPNTEDTLYVPKDSATTLIIGPRTDTVQVTKVWLDKWGQATGISDAEGNITAIQRSDSTFPGLITKIAYPNGQIDTALYDLRGNLQAVTDVNPYGTGSNATTTYTYDPKWDLVTSITSPSGVTTSMAYDPNDANRLWQQPGSDTADHSHRVTFVYDQTSKLLTQISPPMQGLYQISYDSLGNVFKTTTPLNHKTWFNNDGVGRDTLTAMQLDSLGVNWLTTRSEFDALGRDTLTVTAGPAMQGQLPFLNGVTTASEAVTVETFYNREGVTDSVRRSMSPDPNAIGVTTTGYRYDPAYRVIEEIDPLGAIDSYQYDPAGNQTSWITRRHETVTSQYDALNRLQYRTTPLIDFNQQDTSVFKGSGWVFPYTPYQNIAGGYTIAANVDTFTYDPVGHITSASNGDAQVRRTYYLDGSIATDTLAIRTYASQNFLTHVYGIAYTYDLDGRRMTMTRPSFNGPPLSTTTSYGYDPLTGKLATITDFYRNQFSYTYDDAERPATLTYPGQIVDSWTYDTEGRLQTRLEKSLQGGAAGYPDSIIHLDTYTYDWRDKEISVGTQADATYFLYTALGNLYESWTQTATLPSRDQEQGAPDALGNHALRYYQSSRLGAQAADDYTYSYQAKSSRLLSGVGSTAGGTYGEYAWFDASGNKGHAASFDPTFGDEVVSYYAADNRLRALDHRRCVGAQPGNASCLSLGGQLRGSFEEYRYDALGRRILVRANRENLCSGPGCTSEIKAIIWDGNQDIFELRADGSGPNGPIDPNMDAYDAVPSGTNQQFFGRAGYTIGATLDLPLAVEHPTGMIAQYFIPHANWHGLFDQGTTAAGDSISCTPACIDWPAVPNALDYSLLARQEANLDSWSGDLVNQSRDISGQMYMRNRYYDPTTGRFTQEDPAGLGGGLNAYGFANGDVVNYSDPFGLSPCTDGQGHVVPCPEPPGGPPVAPEPGKSGKPNSWVNIGPAAPGRRDRWKPKEPVPTGGGQPSGSWDPAGHWDVDDGLGTRRRYAPDGTPVDHDGNSVPQPNKMDQFIQGVREIWDTPVPDWLPRIPPIWKVPPILNPTASPVAP